MFVCISLVWQATGGALKDSFAHFIQTRQYSRGSLFGFKFSRNSTAKEAKGWLKGKTMGQQKLIIFIFPILFFFPKPSMLRLTTSNFSTFNPIRLYSTAAKATTSVASAGSPVQYVKNADSRKTYLINRYQHLLKDSEIILFVHHNNLLKNESNSFRNQIRELGGELTIIRNNLLNVYFRAENEQHPASVEAQKRTRSNKHPFKPLLAGPTGVITIKETDPSIVAKIIKFLTKNANEKLFLTGARIEKTLFDLEKVHQFKDLKTKSQLQSELAGLLTVLSGVGLVQTLSASSQYLYLNLESHRKNNDPSELAKAEEEPKQE